jgi:hypothetical protein
VEVPLKCRIHSRSISVVPEPLQIDIPSTRLDGRTLTLEQLTPTKDVTQVELPWCPIGTIFSLFGNCGVDIIVEIDHAINLPIIK